MPPRKPLASEPVSQTRLIPIHENGDPFVDFLEACPLIVQAPPYFKYTRTTLIRKSVAKMLDEASRKLNKEYRLAIVEGWRPPYIQSRMHAWSEGRFRMLHPEWSPAVLRSMTNRYTAPMIESAPPPHTTGGAVDLALMDADFKAVEMNAPFESGNPKAYAFYAKGLSEESRRNRQVLAGALEGTDLTNYPSEYWHWSYGDQGWAYRGGHPHAIFAAAQPPGWAPVEEDIEGALERAE